MTHSPCERVMPWRRWKLRCRERMKGQPATNGECLQSAHYAKGTLAADPFPVAGLRIAWAYPVQCQLRWGRWEGSVGEPTSFLPGG